MLELRLSEVMDATGGSLAAGSLEEAGLNHLPPVSIDSRTLRPGEAFLALEGENHDGHRYIEGAVRAGASLVICSRVPRPLPPSPPPLLHVEDTLSALQTIASRMRRLWGGRLIGITGSMGKTTTRHFVASLLKSTYRVLETPGNFNNHIGVPLSLLQLEKNHELAVLELGMNHPGEIARLAEISKPNAALITNIAPVHTEFFSSLDEVAAAKGEILESLSDEGVFFYNKDDSRVRNLAAGFTGKKVSFGLAAGADYRACDLQIRSIDAMRLTIQGPAWSCPVEVPLAGRHFGYNLISAVAVASEYGVEREELAAALTRIDSLPGRGTVFTIDGITIWDDSYNSNPEAVRRLLETLSELGGYRRKVVVLGDMLELGSQSAAFHSEVGQAVPKAGTDVLITVGERAAEIRRGAIEGGFPAGSSRHFEDPETAGQFLHSHLAAGDFVLIKGSRGVRLDRIVETLKGVPK